MPRTTITEARTNNDDVDSQTPIRTHIHTHARALVWPICWSLLLSARLITHAVCVTLSLGWWLNVCSVQFQYTEPVATEGYGCPTSSTHRNCGCWLHACSNTIDQITLHYADGGQQCHSLRLVSFDINSFAFYNTDLLDDCTESRDQPLQLSLRVDTWLSRMCPRHIHSLQSPTTFSILFRTRYGSESELSRCQVWCVSERTRCPTDIPGWGTVRIRFYTIAVSCMQYYAFVEHSPPKLLFAWIQLPFRARCSLLIPSTACHRTLPLGRHEESTRRLKLTEFICPFSRTLLHRPLVQYGTMDSRLSAPTPHQVRTSTLAIILTANKFANFDLVLE